MIKDNKGNVYYKVGLHIHSNISDGRKSPKEIAKEYKNAGYDAIAITDHWIYGKGGEIDGLHIISGCEYNTGASDTMTDGVMHILGLGMKYDPAPARNATRQEIVDAIRKAGGMAVLAHPAWSVNSADDLASLSGIEATEIYNAVSEANQSLRAYSDYFVDLCANREMFPKILATDDAHYYDGNDSCRGWIYVKSKSSADNDILAAIRNGNFFASQGPELFARREGNKIIVRTSPVSIIGVLSNTSWEADRVLRGENLTRFEYEIKPIEKWVRVEITDKSGRKAWSNVFKI